MLTPRRMRVKRMKRPPMYTLHVTDPALDFEGFLVVDSLLHGLSAGGVRMRPGLTVDEVGRLARAMTVKFAAAGIDIGGAKSGINADPNRPDKAAVLHRFGELLSPMLQTCYLAGEDMGTTKADLSVMYGGADTDPITAAKARMQADGVDIPIPDGFNIFDEDGPGLEELLTGHGVAVAVAEAARVIGLSMDGARVSVQGFGNVGGGTVPHLLEMGARIVAVADIDGTLFAEHGLPVETLLAHRDAIGTIDRAHVPEDVQRLPREAWLAVDCDVLIPAAIADAIHGENQADVRARLVVQGANLPCTADAERALAKRGVAVVPDFIANAGAACGFGLLLTAQVPFDPPAIYAEVADRIRQATRTVLEAWQQDGTPPRVAAEALAETALQRFGAS